MNIHYVVYGFNSEVVFPVSQEEAKYAFENLQRGDYFWTSDDWSQAGEIVHKALKQKGTRAVIGLKMNS